jgi:hypothetical protein
MEKRFAKEGKVKFNGYSKVSLKETEQEKSET